MPAKKTYVAFLRGINVGGHHKVPMSHLSQAMEALDCHNVKTILNSGNILFDSDTNIQESKISNHLAKTFGFAIPVMVREYDLIDRLLKKNPFKNRISSKDIRWYVSFLKEDVSNPVRLPWSTADTSFEILCKKDKAVFSILDLSKTSTLKGMDDLETMYGKEMTTRNWNTIERIGIKARDG